MDPHCKLAEKLRQAFKKSVHPPETGQTNLFCTEDSVRTNAAALTELVDCPNPSTCDICIFANYYRQECILLQCTHRKYSALCIHCCARRNIEIYTNPNAFVNAHCNPDPKTWEHGFPTVYTKSTEPNVRTVRERYTTPRSRAQDRRRSDWTQEQQLSLALAYYATGSKLGALQPKVDEKQMKTARKMFQLAADSRSPSPKNKTHKEQQPGPENPGKKTTQEIGNRTESKQEDDQLAAETPETLTVARVHNHESQENIGEMDPETQELAKLILEHHEIEHNKDASQTITLQDKKAKISLVRLCLCSNPQCSARKGIRTNETTMEQPNQIPQIAQTQTKDNKPIRTIQIQFEEWTTFTWEHAAAYINCQGQSTEIKALIDTGSCISIISHKKAMEIVSQQEWKESGGSWDQSVYIKAYSCTNTLLNLNGRITLPKFSLGNKKPLPMSASFWVLQDASEECIIAGQWLVTMKAVMSMQQRAIYYSLPHEPLSAGAEEFVTTRENHTSEPGAGKELNQHRSETEEGEKSDQADNLEEIEDESYPPTLQRVVNHIRKHTPTIPPRGHYSTTVGPAYSQDTTTTGILTNDLPSKISVQQSKLMIHITNTTQESVKLSKISIKTPPSQPVNVQNINNTELPSHLRLDNKEFEKTKNHIEEWTQKQQEQQNTTPTRNRDENTTSILEDLEKLQAQFDFKEYMDSKYLPIDSKELKFTEYPTFGVHPFSEDTDKLTIFLCYILMAMGQTLKLQTLSKAELEIILQDFKEKAVTNLKVKIDSAFRNNNISKLYYKIPIQICHHLHMDFTKAFDNIEKLRKSKKRLPTREYHTIEPTIMRNITIKTQAWSTLLFYVQTLVTELAQTYGQHPYFYSKELPRQQFEEVPTELHNMPPKLIKQILERQRGIKTPRSQEIRVANNRVKNKQELDKILLPTAPAYKDREYTFEQFKKEAFHNYDELNRKAQEQVTPPVHPKIYKALSIDQLESPEEIQEYVKYATSPSALHNFIREQLPPSSDQVIPIGNFVKNLRRAKMVIYNSPEQAIADYIPEQLREQFDQFFTMFKDKEFIQASADLRLPDYPQMWVWGTNEEPSPLHDLNTGLVLPKWLAFCATQMLNKDDIILQPEFATELALLASLIFIYGQFTISLHSSHTGLFREDVFRAKALLCPNTATQNAKPSKNMGLTPCPDLDDKVEFMLRHGKAVRVQASPFLTSMTSIAKKRKTGKPLEFPTDSPILQHLLSLSRSKQEHLAAQSHRITQAREELSASLHQGENSEVAKGCEQGDLTRLKQKAVVEANQPGSEANNRPRISKISASRSTKQKEHLWTRSLFIDQIQQIYLDPSRTHMNNTWDPPFTNQEKKLILKQIDQIYQSSSHIKDQEPKQVKWGSAIITRYDPTDSPDPTKKSSHYPQYFKTQADHDLYEALENNQQVGQGSKHMIQTKDRLLKQQSEEVGYRVKFAYDKQPGRRKTSKAVNPKASRKQGLLTNAHIFHQLIEDTSNLALQARIGPDHPQYEEVLKISIKQIHNGQNPLLQTQTLIKHSQTAASSQEYIKQAMKSIGEHANEVRNINTRNINMEAPENWQQCQKALSLVLGSAMLHTTENANMLASVGPILNRFIRARKHLQAYKLKTKHQQIAQELIKGIWPEKSQEWNSVTIAEAKEHFKGWENLFEETARFYKYPLVIVEGTIVKKAQRAYFDIQGATVYTASQYDEKADLFGHMAACLESNEIFSTKTASTEFIKCMINQAKEKTPNGKGCIRFTIKEILKIQKDYQEKTNKQEADRYSRVHFQHLEMDVYWKRDPFRTIINTRHHNYLSRESNTVFQSQHEIRQSLANSQFFSSFDLSSFYDQILSCPTSSLINTVLYQGQELAMTIASMGSKNSCLWATAVVLSLLHHHTDELLLQPCYLPKPIGRLPMKKQERQMTTEQSYSMIAPLDMPACELVMKVINREQEQERETASQNILDLTPEQRKLLKAGNNHQLVHQVTLIDDFCISTSELPNITTKKEQQKKQLNIHLLCFKQLLMTTIECSRQPENSSRMFQPVKYKIEKAQLFKDSVKFLNFIYIGNHQIINLDAFKGATNLDNLPTTGEELSSRISFFGYFMAYIPNLRYLCKDVEAFGQKFPNNKILPWSDHPQLAQKYRNLATTSRAISGIVVLPNDLNKINFLVLSSDACNKTMAYTVGVSLRPDPDTEEKSEKHSEQQTKLLLVRNYSCNLETNLMNLPIATKECMSAVKTLTMEEPLLKLLRSKKIYHTIDNSVLFGLLEQLQKSKELANHFLAHTQFRDWVLRLHQLTTLYNITVLLVPSKLCMADVCTRSGEAETEDKKQAKKEDKIHCKQIQEKTPRNTCAMCPICKTACHNTAAHSNCPYNIRNSDHLSQHGPQLLNYQDTTEHTIANEGETIKYVTASTIFNPDKYKIFQIDQLVSALDYCPQKTLDQNQAASANRTLHEEIQKLEIIKDSEVEEEIQQIQEAMPEKHYLPGSEAEIKENLTAETNQININMINQVNTEGDQQPTTPTHRSQLRTMPPNLFQINLYGRYKQQPTRRNPENVSILIFTGLRKSMRIAASLYSNQLVGTPTEKLEKRANGVTFTENQGELSYLISCTPQDKLGRKSGGCTENFLPQLHEAIRQAAIKAPKKELILDGNSVQKFYDLPTDKIMTGLILVSRTYRHFFPQIGLVTWHKDPDAKEQNDHGQQLEIILPVFKNKIKRCSLRITLNDRGQCMELIRLLREKVWLGHQARIDIEFHDGSKEIYRRTNMATAQAIHVTQTQQYIRAVGNGKETETNKYSTQEDQSHEPILDAMMAKRKLMINQANDPYLMPILNQIKQAAEQQKILQSEDGKVQLKWKDDIVYGKLSQNHDNEAWKPVIPEAIIMNEIMATHMAQRCSSAQSAVDHIKRIFFHKRHVTSHYDLLTLSKKILPCPRCIIRRPHSRTGNKLYAQNKSIVMSLKGLPCATLAHDIVYITNPQSQEFENKYLSVIVCYGCSFIHLKLINSITGHNIATHVLDMIQMTGNIPHVLITDSATTELRGTMAKCIQSLNVIQLQTNHQILEKRRSPIQHNQPRPQESSLDTEDPTIDPTEFPTVLLDDLSEEQRNMLLQDFVDSVPPLYPPILSHSPVPYIDKQAYRSTSLGRLDSICAQIGIFLRKFVTTQPELLKDENIDYLVQSYAYFHNFLYRDVRTKQTPAKLHLGALRFFNTKAFMQRLQSHETDKDPEPIKKLQMMLQTAHEHREAQNNRLSHDQDSQRQHKAQHGRIKDEKDVQEMFPILSIVMLNSEIDHTKTSKKPNLHGPNLVLARVPSKRTVYLYNLIEGHIYKRNFRAIQNLLPSQEIFSTPNVLDWFHFHPLQMISRLSNTETSQPELTTEQYTMILKNLARVYELLKPVLPTAAETQKIIELDEPSTSEGNRNLPTAEDHNQLYGTTEGGHTEAKPTSKASLKRTVQFRDEEPIETIKDIDRSKQDKEEEDPDSNNIIKTPYQHQGTQGIDVTAPPEPDVPTPPDPDRTRNPGRPKRNRVIPSRYRQDY